MEKKVYTIKEFAGVLRVHSNTVRNAIKHGRILAFRTGKGKRSSYRILETELQRMAAVDISEAIDQAVKNKMNMEN